jgi:hypothetical protein
MSIKTAFYRSSSLILLCGLVNCTPEVLDDDVTDVNEDVGVFEVSHSLSPIVPTVMTVSWSSDAEGMSWVEYGLDGEINKTTPISMSGVEHDIVVLGLKAGRTYSYVAVTETPSGERLEGAVREVSLPNPPTSMPRLLPLISGDERSELKDNFLLTTITRSTGTHQTIVDADGDYVWWYSMDPVLGAVSVTAGRDGRSVVWGAHDNDQIEDLGMIKRVSIDGTEVVESDALMAHHAHAEVSADHMYAWMGQEARDAIGPEGELIEVWGDILYMAQEGDTQSPVQHFNFFDGYRHGVTWDSPMQGAGSPWGIAWTHVNSMTYHNGAFYIGPRWFDSIIKVDGETGEMLWELGGYVPERSDFTFDRENWFSHAHWSQVWDDGAMVFDNNIYNGEISGAMEISWDESTMTSEIVWSYYDPEGRFVMMGGDAIKTPGGNYIISFTQLGFMVEVTPDNEVVWEVELDIGAMTGRMTFIDNIYDFTPPM